MITICDTGPLVAHLNCNDPYQSWAVALMKPARSPMLATEPVLTEVAYFLRADRVDVDPLFRLLERDVLRLNVDPTIIPGMEQGVSAFPGPNWPACDWSVRKSKWEIEVSTQSEGGAASQAGAHVSEDSAHFALSLKVGESHANLAMYLCFDAGPLFFWPWHIDDTGGAGAAGADHSVFVR